MGAAIMRKIFEYHMDPFLLISSVFDPVPEVNLFLVAY